MRTIKELAERKAQLEAELAEVRAEIAARAGQVDDVQHAVKATRTSKAVKKA